MKVRHQWGQRFPHQAIYGSFRLWGLQLLHVHTYGTQSYMYDVNLSPMVLVSLLMLMVDSGLLLAGALGLVR
jgi:hypothetical protein